MCYQAVFLAKFSPWFRCRSRYGNSCVLKCKFKECESFFVILRRFWLWLQQQRWFIGWTRNQARTPSTFEKSTCVQTQTQTVAYILSRQFMKLKRLSLLCSRSFSAQNYTDVPKFVWIIRCSPSLIVPIEFCIPFFIMHSVSVIKPASCLTNSFPFSPKSSDFHSYLKISFQSLWTGKLCNPKVQFTLWWSFSGLAIFYF